MLAVLPSLLNKELVLADDILWVNNSYPFIRLCLQWLSMKNGPSKAIASYK